MSRVRRVDRLSGLREAYALLEASISPDLQNLRASAPEGGGVAMAYVSPNYPTKKALKEALARGAAIDVYAPGLGEIPENGRVAIEGPHYPEPHRWYAQGTMRDGKLIAVK